MSDYLPAGRPAVFLDRDGVLNVDKGYVHKVDDFEWVAGAPEAVRFANDKGYLVIVATNQSGIARGYYTEDDVTALHSWMNEQLGGHEARIDAFFYSPYHPEGTVSRYRRISECRKPCPGMILQAIADWGIDKSRSFLIGDQGRDMLAAERAGIRGHLIAEENLLTLMAKCIATQAE